MDDEVLIVGFGPACPVKCGTSVLLVLLDILEGDLLEHCKRLRASRYEPVLQRQVIFLGNQTRKKCNNANLAGFLNLTPQATKPFLKARPAW